MSIVDINLEEIRILSSSDMKLLEYDSVQEIENENNVLKTGVIILFVLVGVFIAYQTRKEETKKYKTTFENNFID